MYFLSLFTAVITVLPFASQALEVATPSEWLANTTVTVEWISVESDPEYFSIFLYNPALLPTGPMGIADTIDAYWFEYDIQLPRVTPGDGYYLEFTHPGNVSDVLASTGFFPVVQNDIHGSSQPPSSSTLSSNSREPGSLTSSSDSESETSNVRTPTTRSSTETETSTNAQPSEFGGESAAIRAAPLMTLSMLLGAVGVAFLTL